MTADRAIKRATITVALVTGAMFTSVAPATASTTLTGHGGSLLGRTVVAGTGYWVVNRGGGVASGGGAPDLGSLGPSVHLRGPIVAIAATPDGGGYWLASSTGGVYSFGAARFYGAASSVRPARANGPVVGMAAAGDGRGYWLATATGGVYSFGDAKFHGSSRLGRSGLFVVAIAATPTGGGYWLVSSTGRVLCFGDAGYYGSAGRAGPPIVGLAPTPDGHGYWLATATGGVISFGDAHARGSALRPLSPVRFVGIAAEPDGHGYWFANSRGTTYGFGAAAATAAPDLAHGAVAIAADPEVVVRGHPVLASVGARVAETQNAELTATVGRAVADFALSQVGKPYVWGSAGPYGYDCSGLAQASWRVAGVALPRTAAEQYYAGAHIPLDQVEAGDLIFWASDPADPATIYHVAISLGGDSTVQATTTGQNVRVLDLWDQGLMALATRP